MTIPQGKINYSFTFKHFTVYNRYTIKATARYPINSNTADINLINDFWLLYRVWNAYD